MAGDYFSLFKLIEKRLGYSNVFSPSPPWVTLSVFLGSLGGHRSWLVLGEAAVIDRSRFVEM